MSETFSFDAGEFADTRPDAADEALRSIEAEPAQPPDEDPELADVDRRLETADYYRAILNHEFFDVVSDAAQIVDREIRSFIRERLEILLGLRQPRVTGPEAVFEDDEVQALKILAAKVLQKPGLVQSAPAVKKMADPVPAAKPQAPKFRVKPQARKIPAPPMAPSTKPRIKASPVAAPVQAQVKKPAKKPNAEVQTYVNHEGEEVTLIEGEVITEGGNKFLVVKNENGTLYRKSVGGQVVPANRLAPMNDQQLAAYSQVQAQQQVSQYAGEISGLVAEHQLSQKE